MKEPALETVSQIQGGLKQCSDMEPDGSVTMKLRLPDEAALHELAKMMAAFAGGGKSDGQGI